MILFSYDNSPMLGDVAGVHVRMVPSCVTLDYFEVLFVYINIYMNGSVYGD